ncbi:hypothetical protein WMY93_014751 [Mugilogobius chulae]|uniref:C2H2-type domain-containing protein n=1 Tax=Mugilogobius chulae TaxID=88201 RepID=A0AAW0NVU0_9GOBI
MFPSPWRQQYIARPSQFRSVEMEIMSCQANMKMSPDADTQVQRCCGAFRPTPLQTRSCELCGHSWVLHALEKLSPRCVSGCGPVEVAVPRLVLDLSSLVLFGAQAVPIRLKILLDRLYSVLTPDQVGHILHTLGWSLGDYVRGYKLQDSRGRTLDQWLMASPLEEQLILKQFLRFGETRSIVELMTNSFHTEGDLIKPPDSFSTATHKDSVSSFNPTTQKPSVTKTPENRVTFFVKPDPDKPLQTSDPKPEKELSFSPVSTLCTFNFSSSTKPILNSAPSFSSTFFCPTLAPAGSLLSMPHSGVSIVGRKGRVCCGVCGKSFYDKGTLKIHYNAVHLKIKHRCTVSGCTMVFSSLRSRNRHSANPNPRLHTCPENHNDGSFRKNVPNAVNRNRDDELWLSAHQNKNMLIRRETAPAQVQFSADERLHSKSYLREDSFEDSRKCGKSDCDLVKKENSNSESQWEATPKRKSRKSSMPLKIERQKFEIDSAYRPVYRQKTKTAAGRFGWLE